VAKRLSLERVERRLPATARGKNGHKTTAFSVRFAGRIFQVNIGFIVKDGPGAYK
jgi:hypothetical protein